MTHSFPYNETVIWHDLIEDPDDLPWGNFHGYYTILHLSKLVKNEKGGFIYNLAEPYFHFNPEEKVWERYEFMNSAASSSPYEKETKEQVRTIYKSYGTEPRVINRYGGIIRFDKSMAVVAWAEITGDQFPLYTPTIS